MPHSPARPCWPTCAIRAGRPHSDGARRASLVREQIDAAWPACKTHRGLMAAIAEVLPDAIIAGDQTRPGLHRQPGFTNRPARDHLQLQYKAMAPWATACPPLRLGRTEQHPSVCLIGDGGLQFSLAELTSAVTRSPRPSSSGTTQATEKSKPMMAERAVPQIGVDILSARFRCIGQSHGLPRRSPKRHCRIRSRLGCIHPARCANRD